jgi:glutathione synthase/RimK-type ligase-like ATP-grasp enzyme
MTTVALVTAIASCVLDEDLAPLAAACGRAGIEPVIVAWDDPTVSWSRFDGIVLRSTWDYISRLDGFLAWCGRDAVARRLFNAPEVVRWNVDKRYLGELAKSGVPVIPSHYFAPGEDIVLPDSGEFVAKPCVGAGSAGVRRFRAGERDEAARHVRELLDSGSHVLVQPYLEDVDSAGETALLFYDGGFSHAIRKAPLLHRDAAIGTALFAQERISARQPSDAELEVARQVLSALPFATPAYARVDLLPSPSGPMLLELELVEPSMFFASAPDAADRFAATLRQRLRGS